MNKCTKFINIYKQAKDFKYVSLNIIRTGKDKFSEKIMGTQFAVNGIFAIELYLKAIYYYENLKFVRGHELNILYEKLSEKSKNSLKAKKDIEEYFEKYRNGFEKWRYSFETNTLSISIKDTMEVLTLLDEFCESLYKELKVNEQI